MPVSGRRLAEVLSFVGANIRRLRIERGLTQDRLASLSGQDLSYLHRVERGVTILSVAVLVSIAAALEVSPGSLFRPTRIPQRPVGRPRKRPT